MSDDKKTPEYHVVKVSSESDVRGLGVHLFELYRSDIQVKIALTTVGPVTLQKAFRGVIELNSKLVRIGMHVLVDPTYEETLQASGRYESLNRLRLIPKELNFA